MKFMELLTNKQVSPKEVELAIDKWNDDISSESLPDYLGLTNEEFAIFAEHQANERYEGSYSFLEDLIKLPSKIKIKDK